MGRDLNWGDGAIARSLRIIGSVELAVATAAFLFTCAIVSINAGLRYLANTSLVWSEEAALLSTNVFVFLGAAIIFKARADVAVTYFLDKLPPRIAAWLEFLTYLAAAALLGTMVFKSISLWPLQRFTTTFILDISRFWFTVPLIWGAGSMFVASLAFAAQGFDSIRRQSYGRAAPFVAMPVEPE